MDYIRDRKSNISFSLHDSRILQIEINEDKLSLNMDRIFQYTDNEEKWYKGIIEFTNIDKDEIFELENYCTKWGIKHNKWKKDFIYELEKEEKAKVERLNEIRKQIIDPLVAMQQKIKNDNKILLEK